MDLKRCKALALAAGLCAGCTAPVSDVPQAGERRLQLACRNGERLEMRIFDQAGLAELVRDGRTLRLRQEPSESGFRYSDGRTIVRGQGRDVRVELAGGESVQCRSQSD